MNDCKKVLTLLHVQISQGLAMQGHSCLVSINMAECPTDSFSETEFEEIPVAPSSTGPSSSDASVTVNVPSFLSKLLLPICPEREI